MTTANIVGLIALAALILGGLLFVKWIEGAPDKYGYRTGKQVRKIKRNIERRSKR